MALEITLSDEKIIALCNEDKGKAVNFYRDELRDKFDDWRRMFEGDPEFYADPRYRMPAGQYVSRDIMTTVRTVVPDLVRLLTTKEPVTITGRGPEDTDKARKMEALCNWQISRLNDFFLLCETVFQDALLYGMSVVKASWDKVIETRDLSELMTETDMEELLERGGEIKSAALAGRLPDGSCIYDVSCKAGVIVKNQPRLEPLPAAEFLFDPSAKSVKEAAYCIHRKIVDKDYLKRKEDEGVYKNVDRIRTSHSFFSEDEDDLFRNLDHQYRPDSGLDRNEARSTVVLTEYWGKIDVNEDGRLENVVVTYVQDTLLSIEENTFGAYPFFVFSPFPSSFQIPGRGVAEMIADIQTSKTAFVREMLENTRKNNDRKIFYREQAFLYPSQMNDEREKYVAINEKTPLQDVVFQEPFEQLSPNVMGMIQYLDQQRQFNTGISEVKQGIRSSEKQTATEASIKYEAANAQTQIIAVNLSYKFKDLYEFIVEQNQKFIDEPQVIRLLNAPMEITPEDLDGRFDLDVSVSMGAGTAETRLRSLASVLKILLEVAEPRGLTDNGKIRGVLAKLIEESGLKDTDNYLFSSEEVRLAELQTRAAQAAGGETAGINPIEEILPAAQQGGPAL